MSVSILGGKAKGFSLLTPKSNLTRPTAVLLRRKIFDSFQSLEGYSFIDLCAGSGAMGIEAWSRGASDVHLVEANKSASQVIKKNVQSLGSKYEHALRINNVFADCMTWLKNFPSEEINTESVILFLDPPYEKHDIYKEVLGLLQKKRWLGELWIESDKQKGPSPSFLEEYGLDIKKEYKQSTHFILKGRIIL